MTQRAGTACRKPGCPGIVRANVCSKCGPLRNRSDHDDRRGSAASRGYDRRWQKLRQMYLAMNPLCVECMRYGLVSAATDVDHIIPKRHGGTDAEDNLQALCHTCHSRKTARERGNYAMQQRTIVTIVAGPPGAGKTTWVQQQMKWGDLVVDVDALFSALSTLPWYEKPDVLLPFVIEARDALIYRLRRGSDVRAAWVITSEPDPDERAKLAKLAGAREIIILATPASECISRIANDDRRSTATPMWASMIHRWWDDYRTGDGETVINPGRGGQISGPFRV